MRQANRDFWYCNACESQNSRLDGECQFCECGGVSCKRDHCSDVLHFEGDPDDLLAWKAIAVPYA
jgi:hypothetical protein